MLDRNDKLVIGAVAAFTVGFAAWLVYMFGWPTKNGYYLALALGCAASTRLFINPEKPWMLPLGIPFVIASLVFMVLGTGLGI